MLRINLNSISFILFIFLLYSINADPCQGFNSLDLIQTGTVKINNIYQSQYCQQIPINFLIPSSGVQVVSSLQYFNDNNNFTNGIDFSIHSTYNKLSNNLMLTLLINNQCVWTSIGISYFASSRNDLILGRFVGDVEQSLGCSNQNNNNSQKQGLLKSIVPKWSNDQNVSKVIGFISGLRTLQSNISQITISQIQINQTIGIITVSLNFSQQIQIEFIQISYIIVLQNFPYSNDIQGLNSYPDYTMSILFSIKNNNIINQNWAISKNSLKCNSSKCFASCIDSISCSNLAGYAYQQQCLFCQSNQNWNGTQCVANTISSCPNGSTFSLNTKTCVCTQSDTYLINNICSKCQNYSSWNGYQCICQSGYSLSGSNCVSVCSQNQIWSNGKCISNNIINCPLNSIWNSQKLVCQCIDSNQYLINNSCQNCGTNQRWNGQNCVCNPTYYMINNKCATCMNNSTFNGTDCICNQGFYLVNGTCSQCYSTCGTCFGQSSNNCLSCADVTYTLKNNVCIRLNQCPQGLYLNSNSSCTPCTTYCSNCTCDNDCSQCITGFNLQSLTYGGIKVSYCVQICGDGKRFELQCDDGNTNNGDGCDSNCKVQAGWSCSGGSSVQASTCISSIPNASTLSLTGKVLLLGKVVQGVKISYLPSILTTNDCPLCYQLLWVRVIKSDIVPAVSVQYLPKSQYQFLVQFDFHGTFSIPLFMISVQINPQFARYFSPNDLSQIQICTIDPSLLAINDQSTALGIQDISQNSTILSTSLLKKIFT